MRYHSNGKQVLRDGLHFADCIDSGAATLIADALNDRRTISQSQETLQLDGADGPLFVSNYRTTWGTDAHQVRQENDEYACACGARWDVADGEDHP